MREIKFRLRRGNEIVGYEAWDGSNPSAKPSWVYSKDGKIGTLGSISSWSSQLIPHRQKDQYTGLKDKNGVEGYHNDIVRDDYHGNGLIEWNEVQCGWNLHFTLEGSHIYTNLALKEREIIGNIYESNLEDLHCLKEAEDG